MNQLTPLTQKLSSPIPEIQSRALSSLYLKLSHSLLSPAQLLEHPEIPGLLLSWINENRKKSDTLLKVLYILKAYTGFEEGKVLLRRYECLEFCEDFRGYLIGSERAVETFVEALDGIIRELMPLGRSEESMDNDQNTQVNTQQKQKGINPVQQPQKTNKPSTKPSKNAPTIPEYLLLTCPNFPLPEPLQKPLFQLIMKLKYSPKETLYTTLTQIRTLVTLYQINSYRCKGDLWGQLVELVGAGVLAELSGEILGILAKGLFWANTWMVQGELDKHVNLTYAKISPIPQTEIQLSLPLKFFEYEASLPVLLQLIKNPRAGQGASSLKYLLSIFYPASMDYSLQILKLATEQEIVDNQQICIATVEKYCRIYGERARQFLGVLPERVWRKIGILSQWANNSEKEQSLRHIEPYLQQKFQVTKNLHQMRELIDNLKLGLKGCQLRPKQCSKLYMQVLATLAISVSKQDPISSYYPQAQSLVLTLLLTSPQPLLLALHTHILSSLSNPKDLISYPGLTVLKSQVIEVLFSSVQFVRQWLKSALEDPRVLGVAGEVVEVMLGRGKGKVFGAFIAILFALCGHPQPEVAGRIGRIIAKMPKNYAITCIACKLFSNNPETRRKILSDLSSKPEPQPDIIEKILLGHFAPKKKPLKISKASVDNYFNIVLNPSLELAIKQQAINQFIDCIDRMEAGKDKERDQIGDLSQARACLVEELRRAAKKEKFQGLDEKMIVMHLGLESKLDGYGGGRVAFGVEFLIGLLGRANYAPCRAALLTSIYVQVFQSPFTDEPLTKNYTMNYFPHVQLVKMRMQHPIHSQQAPKDQQLPSQGIKSPASTPFSVILHSPNPSLVPSPLLQSLQQQVITAITTTNIPKLSRLSFLYKHCPQLKLSKSCMKIIVQFVRTNPSARDVADDLARLLSRGEDNWDVGNAGGLGLLLAMMKGKTIGNEEMDRLMRDVEDQPSKCRLFIFLIKQTAVKFSSFNQYTSLKLLQSLISSLRSPTSALHLRILSLTLLHKLSLSEMDLSDNLATLFTLLHTLLFQQKLTAMEFGLALACMGKLMGKKGCDQGLRFGKLGLGVVDGLCGLIGGYAKELESEKGRKSGGKLSMIPAVVFQLLNTLLQTQLLCQPPTQHYFQTVLSNPNNLLILSTSLLPKSLSQSPCPERLLLLTTQIFSFLYLYTCNNQQATLTLMNSTDVVAVFLDLLAQAAGAQGLPIEARVGFFQAAGNFGCNLTTHPDQFVYKLNRILRNQAMGASTNPEYKLHYTLMAPIPFLSSTPQKKRSLSSTSYLKMVSRLLSIWRQETQILEQQDFVQPLVQYALQIKQIESLAPLLMKSSMVQKLVAGSTVVGEKIRGWIRVVQELIYERTKASKKLGLSKVDFPQQVNLLKQGLIFTATIFTVTQDSSPSVIINQQLSPAFKQTIINCIKLIDQVTILLQLTPDQQLERVQQRVVRNIFNNPLASISLSSLISESQFETIHKVFQKIQSATEHTLLDYNEQLELLGDIACHESVRSLIIKGRLIEHLVALLVASNHQLIAVEDNKVAKIHYGLVFGVVGLLAVLAQYKDTNLKIQNQKKLLEFLTKILSLQPSQVISQKILVLLINLSAFKHSKPMLMSHKQLHKVCLGLLSDPDYPQELKQQILCLIYNILYKNAAGLRLYRRKEVLELFEGLAMIRTDEDGEEQGEGLGQMAGLLVEILNQGE